MGMTRNSAILIAVTTALLLPLMSCGDESASTTTEPTPTTASGPRQSADGVGEVSLTRSGGIAGGFVMIVVQPDGSILRTDDPDQAPAATGETMPAAELEALQASVGSQEFADLDSTYVPPDLCCDQFHYEVTAEVDGEQITSATADGIEALAALEEVVAQMNALG